MTSLRLIGIAPAEAVAATAVAPMMTVDCGPIIAYVIGTDEAITLDAIKAHHQMVITRLGWGAFLPAVVGLEYATRERLLADIIPRAETLLSLVLRLEGRAEWSLRVRPVAINGDEGMSGRAYLRARQATTRQFAAARQVADSLCARLAATGLVDDAIVGHSQAESLSFNLLLRRTCANAVLDEVADSVSRLLPDATMRRSGPWPAYSFSPLRPAPKGRVQ
jgi:hypothetical protein